MIYLLEIGAGTGIFSRSFCQVFQRILQTFNLISVDFVLVCVEPVESMIAQFLSSQEVMRAGSEEIQLLAQKMKIFSATVTNIPSSQYIVDKLFSDPKTSISLSGLSKERVYHDIEEGFDAVLIAQAFHWFSTKQALASISRQLGSKTQMFLLWNSYQIPGTWHRRVYDEVIRQYYEESNTPNQTSEKWKQAFLPDDPCLQQTRENLTGFEQDLEFFQFEGETSYLLEEPLLRRFETISVIAQLPLEEKAKVRREIMLIANSSQLSTDNTGQRIYTIENVTNLYIALTYHE